MLGLAAALALFASVSYVLPLASAQVSHFPPPSWPNAYPNMPSGDYSPAWQHCTWSRGALIPLTVTAPARADFEVTEQLPNVTWDAPRSFAGNIGVQRVGHPNNTLFFWAFEKDSGSLTVHGSEPWGIFLNGGSVV